MFFTKSKAIELDRLIANNGNTYFSASSYNVAMRETLGQGTVGSYLGLTASQINTGIFENVGE